MSLPDQPAIVKHLAALGFPQDPDHWQAYDQHGIGRVHIPALIELLQDAASYLNNIELDENDPVAWAPVHAWRALGQMQAVEALPVLLDLLALLDTSADDLVMDELPDVFAALGPAALPQLCGYLLEPEHGIWARGAVAEGMKNIALHYPEMRQPVLRTLMGALEGYNVEEPGFNAFLIAYLMDLKAVEAAPLVENVFNAGRVNEIVTGDWEDFQIAIGLLDRRLNPRKRRKPAVSPAADGILVQPDAAAAQSAAPEAAHQKMFAKIEKNRRKRARRRLNKNDKRKE